MPFHSLSDEMRKEATRQHLAHITDWFLTPHKCELFDIKEQPETFSKKCLRTDKEERPHHTEIWKVRFHFSWKRRNCTLGTKLTKDRGQL